MTPKELTMFNLAIDGNVSEFIKLIQENNNENSDKQKSEDFIQVRDNNGMQMIHHASKGGHSRFVYELLKLGADANGKCFKGNTSVHYACMSSSLPCIVTLVGMGGDLREINFEGENALAVIPEGRQVKLGSLLREAEKNINERQKQEKESQIKVESIFDQITNQPESYPIKIITNHVCVSTDVELAKGPHASFCKGKMLSMPVMIKQKYKDSFELLQEANNLRCLRHPNISLLLGILNTEPRSYQLVFEFSTHGFLHRDLFISNLILKSVDILRIGRDISNALAYIHEEGFVHSSVASFSVTLTQMLSAKICNFENMQRAEKATSISHLTSLYSYMAPEQLQGYPAHVLNDVYGMGVVLYECATSKRMLDVNVALKHYDESVDLAYRLKKIPKHHEETVTTLIESCLSKRKRRPTAKQVTEWLDALLNCRLATLSPLKMVREETQSLEINK